MKWLAMILWLWIDSRVGQGFFSSPLCRDRLCDSASFLPDNCYAWVNWSERGTDYSPFKCVSATCKNLWPCTSTPVHKIVHRCLIKHENYMRGLSVVLWKSFCIILQTFRWNWGAKCSRILRRRKFAIHDLGTGKIGG